MKFDLKELKKLINLVEEANVTELSIEDKEGEKVSIKKQMEVANLITNNPLMPQSIPPQPANDDNKQGHTPCNKKTEPEQDNLIPIKSPMVGTFYSSPNPESPPYVKVGTRINKGDVVCIIEAMKLFNEIESEKDGIIEKILVENSASVEYGQTIMLLKPC